jgi:tRNA uridine 5-carboxymethylaminomethyl modification enzyme
MKHATERQDKLDIKQGLVERILAKDGRIQGVATDLHEVFHAKAVVIATGTFLKGVIHIGGTHMPAGRMGELPAVALSSSLREHGFDIKRLRTCTTARIDGKTVDFTRLQAQHHDESTHPFSAATEELPRTVVPCYITFTNQRTHDAIRTGMHESLFFSGDSDVMGPRYCPSVEDKIAKFPDKDRHQIFLEPEGLSTYEYYANGLYTGLSVDVQFKMLRTIEGLKQVELTRPGYGIEYDYVDPLQLRPTLETRLVAGLYHAGQINGTSGYEEAAAQGIMAGINAALKIREQSEFVLDRSQAYAGVLIDDLVTKGTREPYRMFTSRAEYRLVLREDNADLRLTEKAFRLGLINEAVFKRVQEKQQAINREIQRLAEVTLKPRAGINDRLKALGTTPIKNTVSLQELLRRPECSYGQLGGFDSSRRPLPSDVVEQVELEVKYAGYIRKQEELITKFRRMEELRIPESMTYERIPGLSAEVQEKLSRVKPATLGQASRISGVTPSALSVMMVELKRMGAV